MSETPRKGWLKPFGFIYTNGKPDPVETFKKLNLHLENMYGTPAEFEQRIRADERKRLEGVIGDQTGNKIHPLPWRHETDGRQMSAVVDVEGVVVAGSLICRQFGDVMKTINTHEWIVEVANKEWNGGR